MLDTDESDATSDDSSSSSGTDSESDNNEDLLNDLLLKTNEFYLTNNLDLSKFKEEYN